MKKPTEPTLETLWRRETFSSYYPPIVFTNTLTRKQLSPSNSNVPVFLPVVVNQGGCIFLHYDAAIGKMRECGKPAGLSLRPGNKRFPLCSEHAEYVLSLFTIPPPMESST